ncbi:MAG: hypothetical protein HQL73_01075 [Magnetococcales bacterium]|nr:hypothetical protein [Magnetococcales bacterium]
MMRKLVLIGFSATLLTFIPGLTYATWISHSAMTIQDTVTWINNSCRPVQASHVKGMINETDNHAVEFHVWCYTGNSQNQYEAVDQGPNTTGITSLLNVNAENIGILGAYNTPAKQIKYILQPVNASRPPSEPGRGR